jgi:acyl carrier protein
LEGLVEEQEIYNGIKKILSETFKLKSEEIKLGSRLDEDLGLDSIDIMDSVGLFEAKFHIVIFDENAKTGPRIQTVQDLVTLVRERKAE